jgi:CopG family nickel-responsive transcriptional regulator
MDGDLARAFDRRIAAGGYTNRSEAVRDLVRDYLVRGEWSDADGEVVGSVTLVYDHGAREAGRRVSALQHDHSEVVVCSTHVHLDAHTCLEIVVLRGQARDVRSAADRLIGARGVKHGHLACVGTPPG